MDDQRILLDYETIKGLSPGRSGQWSGFLNITISIWMNSPQ